MRVFAAFITVLGLVACSFQGGQAAPNSDDAAPDAAGDAGGGADAEPDAALAEFVYAGPRNRLYRVAVPSLVPTLVGDFERNGVPTSIEDTAVDANGRLVGLGRGSTLILYDIDPETAALTMLAPVPNPNGTFRGLSFGYPAGVETLYATTDSGNLYIVDLIDGGLDFVGTFGGYGTRGDIAWIDGIGLVAAANDFAASPAPLALINTDDGTAEVLGITEEHHLGLAVRDGVLYGFAEASNDIYVISPTDGTTIARAGSIINWEHAAP